MARTLPLAGRQAAIGIAALATLILAAPVSRAAHPLITEDTDTQGRGHIQLELNTEHITTTSTGQHQYTALTNGVFTYGALDPLDVIVTIPHLRVGASAADGTAGTHGMADVSLDLKWRFFESGPWSLAFIPGASFPTGDETRQLGTGRTSWNAFVVTSYKLEDWAFHLHVGHVHNNNTFSERVNVWHGSAAAVYSVVKSVRLILDAGIDTHTERGSASDPVFLITGVIWSPRDNFDVDLGFRWEQGDSTNGRVLLAGLTWRH